MKFSVILDSIQSKVVPSEDTVGLTFKQAVDEIINYCQESEYSLQEEFFHLVREHQEQYLSGQFPLSLA